MQIDRIVCSEEIADKLESKHNVKTIEAEEVLLNQPRTRFAEKGHTEQSELRQREQPFPLLYLLMHKKQYSKSRLNQIWTRTHTERHGLKGAFVICPCISVCVRVQ